MRALLLLSLVIACSPSETPGRPAAEAAPIAVAPQQQPQQQPSPTVPPATAARMAGHMRDAVKVREAVIAGELDDVRGPAGRLAEQLATDELPPAWQPHVRTATRLAVAARDARSIGAAAVAAAGLGRACGECHSTVENGPKFPPPGPPPPSPAHDPRAQMARHQWAADQMWQALVGRTDAGWSAAAAALADAQLSIEDITADVELPEELLHLGDRVHEIGRRASATSDWNARADIYGEFLATCATCHRGGC